jgi:hypothetical protein
VACITEAGCVRRVGRRDDRRGWAGMTRQSWRRTRAGQGHRERRREGAWDPRGWGVHEDGRRVEDGRSVAASG